VSGDSTRGHTSPAWEGRRPKVGLAASELIRSTYIDAADIQRLETVADFVFQPFSVGGGGIAPVPSEPEAEAELGRFAADLDALVVCHGSPYVNKAVLDAAPLLSLIGELEGDRFAYHFDVAAAAARGVLVVDTTHGSSWPTAEWALGLALIGLRNAGFFFRRMIAHQLAYPDGRPRSGPGFDGAELTGKRVGLIGFGHLARRLVELLAPFHVEIVAFDPFVPRDLADAYGVEFGPLSSVMTRDVVFSLVPLTPATAKMIGADELDLLRSGSVFVNVSRGAVVDTAALVERFRRGDAIACLDVFDPEPIPVDSPILDFPNVFVSPHLAGVTEESRRKFFHLMVGELLRHFDGLEPRSELPASVVSLRTSGDVDAPREEGA
jgi:D-3-phosphoglycerate dehydrogenase